MRSTGFLLVASLLSTLASAQSFTPVREQKNLSPAALAKLHTLEELNLLPPGDWRFHAGDIAHGESPTLDDSAWQLIPAPTGRASVKAPKDAVWYRREITVPRTVGGYDISGSRVTFQFEADANGPMPEIIYFNGRRVALGDDLEPIILAEPAHPGDKILVAVKLLHTVDEKTFRGVSMQIQLPFDSKRPSPNDIRVECISAADLLPNLAKPRPDLLPRVEAAVAAIDTEALAHANQAAFDASLRKSQAILNELHPVLGGAEIGVDNHVLEIHPALDGAHITLDGNAHIDAAWLWPRSETIDAVRRTFTTALQLMNEYPDYKFTQSAAQYYEWMADKYPDLNDQIKQRIKEGRWEVVGGMWIEPDLNIPTGESQVRQLLVGQRFFQKEYGVTARIGWNPDSFGYNWQLPQIYKRSGLDYFVTQKMHWNDTNILPLRLFWWESPDGSKVLTYFPTDYAWTNVSPTRLSADFVESAQRNPGTAQDLDLYGVGDHGGGPTRAMLDDGDHWMTVQSGIPTASIHSSPAAIPIAPSRGATATGTTGGALPAMHYGTAQSYFDDVQARLNPDSPTWNYDKLAGGWTPPPTDAKGNMGIPTWKDELYFEYHRGIYTTQAKHKDNIRKSEVATLDTEKLSSFAWLNGATYPADEITDNWKKITFNQFHDLAAGSGIAVIYRDAQKDFTTVFNTDKLMTDAALHTLDTVIDTRGKGDTPVLVTNPSAWPRTETLELKVQLPEAAKDVRLLDANNHPVASQVLHTDNATHQFTLLAHVNNVPALGYTVFHAESAKSDSPDKHEAGTLHVDQNGSAIVLDNSTLHVAIDKSTGCISTLTAHGGQSFIAPNSCGNQLQTYVDKPKNYDAWNIDPGTLDGTMTPISQVDSISVITDGPLRKTVRIQRTWSQSHFTQDISLDADADFVRVDTTVQWHETHVLLKAAFPLAASGPKATFEIPYGTIQRPTTRNNSFEKAQFEVPALQWADLGGKIGDADQGVSILNDSKYGYDALGNTLRLTLLRSPTWPDPDADRGPQHFTYAIYPHAGTWKEADTVHRAYELNDPLTATQVFAHAGSLPPTHSFASIDEKNVILTAVKKAEDADALIFRMVEYNGTPTDVHLHIPAGATYAVESNLMEKVDTTHLPLANDTITIPIKPYEILTLSVTYPHAAPDTQRATVTQ